MKDRILLFLFVVNGLLIISGCEEEPKTDKYLYEESELPSIPGGIPYAKSLELSIEEIDSLKNSGKTNLLFILADDLGMGDLNCYGNKKMFTPNIDRLAEEGVMLNNMHSSSSVCSPSRAAFLSGHFPMRYKYYHHFWDTGFTYLADSIPTIAELFRENGYFTSHIGKWHLGGLTPREIKSRINGDSTTPGPGEAGFDHYLCWFEDQNIHWRVAKMNAHYRENWRYTIRNDSLLPVERAHLSELKTAEAIRVMKACQKNDRPFFLNLWLDIPHMPYEPYPGEYYDHYKKLGYVDDWINAQVLISKMDEEMGKIFEFLKESGLSENTLVVFTSDNGPTLGGSSGKYKGGKGTVYEGGLRIPCIFYGLDQDKSIVDDKNSLNFVDFFPSLVDYFNLDSKKERDLDGLNFFDPNSDFYSRALYYKTAPFHFVGPIGNDKYIPASGNIAISKDGFKLIMEKQNVLGLYNLLKDPFEENDLQNSHYQKIVELQYYFRKYEYEVNSNKGIPEFMNPNGKVQWGIFHKD